MIKLYTQLLFVFIMVPFLVRAEKQTEDKSFWQRLTQNCGKAFEGKVIAGGKEGDAFEGKKLIMHIRRCGPDTIKIPFFVGEDKSRTWVLYYKDNRIVLKHDHRLPDGSEDSITQYGGKSTNNGKEGIQIFPADDYTCKLIDYACANIWWITIDEGNFTYNLRRIGSDRLFTVSFDLTKEIEWKESPWGWSTN